MSDAELWEAVAGLAAAWAGSPIVKRFSAQLPLNADQRSTGLPGLLQQLEAGGGGIAGRPLRIGRHLPLILEVMPGIDADALGGLGRAWLQDAQSIEDAHRRTVAWLRSRLPGYPSIPAPQLTRNTPLTTLEYTWRLIWTPEERRRGLQFKSEPDSIDSALQIAQQAQRRDLGELTRGLLYAFEKSEPWRLFEKAHRALDEVAMENLRLAKRKIAARLGEEAVTAYEPENAMRRDSYRQAVVQEEIDRIDGAAREYADAFSRLDDFIELAASDVFGQLAIYGHPLRLNQPRNLSVEPGNAAIVSFDLAENEVIFEPGRLAWLGDSLINDAIHIREFTLRDDVVYGTVESVTAVVLDGTADGWASFAVDRA